MKCKSCGKEIAAGAKFCRFCGAKNESADKVCPVCMKTCAPTAKFCPDCGAKLDTQTPLKPLGAESNESKPDARKETISRAAVQKTAVKAETETKKNKDKPNKKGKRALSLLLAAALVFVGVKIYRDREITDPLTEYAYGGNGSGNPYFDLSDSEPEFTGCSDIVYDTADALYTETAYIGGDVTDCAFDCGASISFDPFGASDSSSDSDEHSVSVSVLGEKSGGDYECTAYDFTLDGGEAQLDGMARISVPYDSSWGDNVFVQYYNAERGKWEMLYTETDGNGGAVFYTDHFCTFGVFRDMVVSGNVSSEDGKIFRIVGDDRANLKIETDYAALAAYLRQQSPSTVKEVSGQSREYFIEKGLDTIGFDASAADIGVKGTGTAALAGGLDGIAGFSKSLSDGLGHFGAVLTVSKLMTSVYRRGADADYFELLKDSNSDLASLALYAGGVLSAGSAAAFCNAAGIMLFVYSAADSALTSINLDGCGTAEDYAYREFTTKYLVYNTKTGVCGARYVTDAWSDAQTCYDADDIPLPSDPECDYSDWKPVFDGIKKLNPDKIGDAVDNILTQYVSVFWNLPKTNPSALKSFLENTRSGLYSTSRLSESYERPSAFKIKEYKAALKADLYRWLRPYVQECLKSSYFSMLNDAFREAAELEEQFNSELSFVLSDSESESFADSRYADTLLTLSGSGGDGTFTFTKDNGYRVNCTYLSYILAGAPKRFTSVSEKDGELASFDITPTYPETVITIGEAEEIPVVDELTDGYVWALTDVWCADVSNEEKFPLRKFAIYNNGDNMLVNFDYRCNAVLDETTCGFSADIDSSYLSHCKAKVTCPGMRVASSGDFVFGCTISEFSNKLSDSPEASAIYFEVSAKTSRTGSVYYLTDGNTAVITGGSLGSETLADFPVNGNLVPGTALIPEPSGGTEGSKVMFEVFGVCYLYRVMTSEDAVWISPDIHRGSSWAYSQAENALD